MTLKRERRGHVEILTLCRPEVRNAFDAALSVALYDSLTEIESDDDVRAVVLTGAGDKSFSSGADLKAACPVSFPWWSESVCTYLGLER